MTAVTGFVAIVSLLLALTAGGGAPKPQAGTCPPFMCGSDSNHSETLVRDTAPVNWQERRS